MGTRNHPGIFDCTPAKLLPGEPYFILAGRDVLAADIVEVWAIRAKCHGCNHDKTREAMHLADEMREWPHRSHMGILSDFSTLDPDEPHFMLRGRDCLAAELVDTWAMRASEVGYSPETIISAMQIAALMHKFPGQKNPD